MRKIRLLKNTWELDDSTQLGKSGGFGAVFVGYGSDDGKVAIKRLHEVDPDMAKREISIVNKFIGQKFENVLEFLDSGFDEETNYYYIVMPKADYDLASAISSKRILTEGETVEIMLQVSKGLFEVNDLVHRDLKPGNILFHDGIWKIADFGIARFVESTTSTHTLRDFMTFPYAAPEQWRGERTTKETDIYALGIIAYQLLSGSLPFPGPTYEDFRDQHLHRNIPQIAGVSPRLNTLISLMLSKAAAARPSTHRVIELLTGILSATRGHDFLSSGLRALSEASAIEAERLSKAEAEIAIANSKAEARSILASSALEILYSVIEAFFGQIRTVAPLAQFDSPSFGVTLGSAALVIERLEPTVIAPDSFHRSGWDVITGAFISILQSSPKKYLWSSNLWYTNLGRNNEYRWWEVKYMKNPLSSEQPEFQPFYIKELDAADRAAAPGSDKYQLGAKPIPIDGEAIQDFCSRWAELFAKAYRGELEHPTNLPLS